LPFTTYTFLAASTDILLGNLVEFGTTTSIIPAGKITIAELVLSDRKQPFQYFNL
jgi:hypothetical protein